MVRPLVVFRCWWDVVPKQCRVAMAMVWKYGEMAIHTLDLLSRTLEIQAQPTTLSSILVKRDRERASLHTAYASYMYRCTVHIMMASMADPSALGVSDDEFVSSETPTAARHHASCTLPPPLTPQMCTRINVVVS